MEEKLPYKPVCPQTGLSRRPVNCSWSVCRHNFLKGRKFPFHFLVDITSIYFKNTLQCPYFGSTISWNKDSLKKMFKIITDKTWNCHKSRTETCIISFLNFVLQLWIFDTNKIWILLFSILICYIHIILCQFILTGYILCISIYMICTRILCTRTGSPNCRLMDKGWDRKKER